ncbi:MAG TPA: TonB family protein [Sphingobacteriaceae bacterium]
MTKRQHDIERYLRGEMTSSEMHALEREALNDPFLSDALEGAQSAQPDHFLFDLQELRSSVANRAGKRKPKIISMWNWSIGIAAGLLLVAVSGIYVIGKLGDRRPMLAENIENVDPAAFGKSAYDTIEIQMPRVWQTSRETAPIRRIERVATERGVIRHAEREVEVNLTDPATLRIEEAADEQPRDMSSTAISVKPRTIKGKVTSAEDGSGLPGVNVLVKGTNVGTITDAEGNYEIVLNQPDQKLEFTFIGVKTVVAETRNKTQLNVSLTPDYESLSEVVVSGAAVKEQHSTFNLAEPEGGRDAFAKYLSEKLVYPEQALANEVEGRVTIQFTIDLNGHIGNFKVLSSLGYGCDDEAIRLIREGPAWAPSKKNDKPVAEEVTVGVKFDIPDKKDP